MKIFVPGGVVALLALAALLTPASAEKNCRTALTRIAQREAENAIKQHQNDACAGLKTKIAGISVGIDDTKNLSLRSFELCEEGPLVSASISVHIQCSSGRGAAFVVSIEDDVTAIASANLDTCQIIDAKVSGASRLVQAGLNIGNVSGKLRESAQREIAPYCNK